MRSLFTMLLVLGLIAALPVRAEEPADGAKKEARAEKPKKLRLVKPWADLSTLSEEQRAKISEIHADYVEKMSQLRDEEEAAILALLSDENKSELEKLAGDKKQANKERAAARKAERATTRPSDGN